MSEKSKCINERLPVEVIRCVIFSTAQSLPEMPPPPSRAHLGRHSDPPHFFRALFLLNCYRVCVLWKDIVTELLPSCGRLIVNGQGQGLWPWKGPGRHEAVESVYTSNTTEVENVLATYPNIRFLTWGSRAYPVLRAWGSHDLSAGRVASFPRDFFNWSMFSSQDQLLGARLYSLTLTNVVVETTQSTSNKYRLALPQLRELNLSDCIIRSRKLARFNKNGSQTFPFASSPFHTLSIKILQDRVERFVEARFWTEQLDNIRELIQEQRETLQRLSLLDFGINLQGLWDESLPGLETCESIHTLSTMPHCLLARDTPLTGSHSAVSKFTMIRLPSNLKKLVLVRPEVDGGMSPLAELQTSLLSKELIPGLEELHLPREFYNSYDDGTDILGDELEDLSSGGKVRVGCSDFRNWNRERGLSS
ncbi:hypothetical protein T439DRAFT_356190 [Meredithblackwellia eburnea MCA 4105]